MPKKRFQLRVILADVNDDDEDAASVGRTYVTHAGCPNIWHPGYLFQFILFHGYEARW